MAPEDKSFASLRHALAQILTTVDPWEKASRAARAASGDIDPRSSRPEQGWPWPAQREAPPTASPGSMPKRGLGTVSGRCALLHAVAHIELNAIDLAADMAGRFADQIPKAHQRAFVADWVGVMADEARHFLMVSERLEALRGRYGALPAHDGLFDAARRTSSDVAARLAVAPMILEARGLDVTPGMIARLDRAGDTRSADVLRVIYEEEVGHVAAGVRWFECVAIDRCKAPGDYFRSLVEKWFPGGPKPPFNIEARERAGFARKWYDTAA